MALKVEIDRRSGFCGGVIRAISRAEEFLAGNPSRKLYSITKPNSRGLETRDL